MKNIDFHVKHILSMCIGNDKGINVNEKNK
jgi:hypothetical protein